MITRSSPTSARTSRMALLSTPSGSREAVPRASRTAGTPNSMMPPTPSSTASAAARLSDSVVCCTTPGMEVMGAGSVRPSRMKAGRISSAGASRYSAVSRRMAGVVRRRRGRWFGKLIWVSLRWRKRCSRAAHNAVRGGYFGGGGHRDAQRGSFRRRRTPDGDEAAPAQRQQASRRCGGRRWARRRRRRRSCRRRAPAAPRGGLSSGGAAWAGTADGGRQFRCQAEFRPGRVIHGVVGHDGRSRRRPWRPGPRATRAQRCPPAAGARVPGLRSRGPPARRRTGCPPGRAPRECPGFQDLPRGRPDRGHPVPAGQPARPAWCRARPPFPRAPGRW